MIATLNVFNLVYSINKLKEQVYYLLEKDPEYMKKSKNVKNSFFNDNYCEKSSIKLPKTRVLPTLNSQLGDLGASWKQRTERRFPDNLKSEPGWRKIRSLMYQENIEMADEEED